MTKTLTATFSNGKTISRKTAREYTHAFQNNLFTGFASSYEKAVTEAKKTYRCQFQGDWKFEVVATVSN